MRCINDFLKSGGAELLFPQPCINPFAIGLRPLLCHAFVFRAQLVKEINNFRFRRGFLAVPCFRCFDDDVDNIGETPAAPAALVERMIDFQRRNELPLILGQKILDGGDDITSADDVALTDQHSRTGFGRTGIPAPFAKCRENTTQLNRSQTL